jgi:aminoglycoside phosphotransferase family enzyme/predicted kinase
MRPASRLGESGEAIAIDTVSSALLRPEAFPGDASAREKLELIQTHLSWVFLTGKRVYKVRKPVALGFVDFCSQSSRNQDCLREVALNRRLAPDVYLGVAPLKGGPAGAWVGPVGESLSAGFEHCVVMRRLPAGRDALRLLLRGSLSEAHLEAVARMLADLHRHSGLGVPAPFSSEAWLASCCEPLRACGRALEGVDARVAPAGQLARCLARASSFERTCADRFEARREAGRAVDGHGDLHLDHVWFERGADHPIAIDCLEFDESLRRIDAASEVAFLAMDLRYRDSWRLGERFLSAYAGEMDDYGLYGVVDYFIAYRALVRAKVAALASRDVGIPELQRESAGESARRHVELADRALAPSGRGRLIAVGGAVGTGKTTVAAAVADHLGGVVISADRVRKHLLGLAATDRAPESAYEPAARRRIYGAILDRANPVLESGRTVVLDATFGCAALRDRVLTLGHQRDVPTHFIEVRCSPDVARRRLARRAAEGRSASDAGPELHDASRVGFEPPTEWPEADRICIETDVTSWPMAVARFCERVSAQDPTEDPGT